MRTGKRTTWLDKTRKIRGLLARVNADVDADVDPLTAIYARWNLARFVSRRQFSEYGSARRERVRRQIAKMLRREGAEREQGQGTSRGGSEATA